MHICGQRQMNMEKHKGRKERRKRDEFGTVKAVTVTIDQILLIICHAVQYLPVNCNAVLSCAAA